MLAFYGTNMPNFKFASRSALLQKKNYGLSYSTLVLYSRDIEGVGAIRDKI